MKPINIQLTTINGDKKLIKKWDVVVNSVGHVGQVLTVEYGYGYQHEGLVYYPFGYGKSTEPFTTKVCLDHMVSLPGARIFNSRYDNAGLGVSAGDKIGLYNKKAFRNIPGINIYDDPASLAKAVKQHLLQ